MVKNRTTLDLAIEDKKKEYSTEKTFPENEFAMKLFGAYHANLAHIEQKLGGVIHTRGNQVTILGSSETVDLISSVLDKLYGRAKAGASIDLDEVDVALSMVSGVDKKLSGTDATIKTPNLHVSPRSTNQANFIKAMNAQKLVFGQGPAGTGKTFLAVAMAVQQLMNGEVDRIILSRPAVEAGEQLGFLPGDMREKVDPYLRPLFDALYLMLPESRVAKKLEHGEIEIAPLAFMRGRTLSNSFIILDEAQNTTAIQMKMFLTRLGANSKMVITGDLTQIDLPRGVRSGLMEAVKILEHVREITTIHFNEEDVIRHALVTRIIRAYNTAGAKKTTLQNEN